MAFRTLDGVDVAGKRVLLRADLNVPVRDGKVADLNRIERLAPTIKELAGKGAKVVVCSHFDRSKGKRVPEMSLAPIAVALGEVLGSSVSFADDCIGEAAAFAVGSLANGGVLVLENTRYHAAEEKNDAAFAAELAKSGDIFVSDAFSLFMKQVALFSSGVALADNSTPCLRKASRIAGTAFAISDDMRATMSRGVFGSPYVIVDGEAFWGFDRFDQIEALLRDGRI